MTPKSLTELKIDAIKYYSLNGIPKVIEVALNKMFRQKPIDVNGYLSWFFETRSNPTVYHAWTLEKENTNAGCEYRVFCLFGTQREASKVIAEVTVQKSCDGENRRASLCEPSHWDSTQFMQDEVDCLLKGTQIDIAVLLERDEKFRRLYKTMIEEQMRQATPSPDSEKIEDPEGAPINTERKSLSVPGKKKGTTTSMTIRPSIPASLTLPAAYDITTVSIALCVAAANSLNPPKPLYQYVECVAEAIRSQNFQDESNNESPMSNPTPHLPLPLITILNVPGSGFQFVTGKCKFIREVFLIPSPRLNPAEPCPQMICENGAPGLPIDRPEQALDLIVECLNQLQMQDNFMTGLHLVSQSIFDQIKGKYEPIAGTLKSPEELVNFYADILNKYPSIRLLIDPFRKEDKQCWNSINEQFGSRVLLSTSNAPQPMQSSAGSRKPSGKDTKGAAPSPIPLADCSGPTILELAEQVGQEHTPESMVPETDIDVNGLKGSENTIGSVDSPENIPFVYSSWMFNVVPELDCCLVSELIKAVQHAKDQEKRSIFSMDSMHSEELWPVELAIGMGVSFMKLGGMNSMETTSKLKHWLRIARGRHPLLASSGSSYDTHGENLVWHLEMSDPFPVEETEE